MKNKILFIYLLIILVFIPLVSASDIYISQGDTVYVNDTIDISGVVPPYPYLAYWDGYDMYNYNATYLIDLPTRHSAYYNFTLDPKIFASRTGKWYKYNSKFEGNSNNLAFIVMPEILKNSTMRYQNGTLINVSTVVPQNETQKLVIPIPPPVPLKYVSDYLIARGDSWNMTFNQTTNIWLFGTTDELMDQRTVNNSIDVSKDILENFQPGNYKLVVQTIKNGSSDFTVKYDPDDYSIKWFDPKTFTVHSENVYGYSPGVTMEKFKEIMPQSYDDFKTYNFVIQNPSIEIISMNEVNSPNETVDLTGTPHYNTNASFIDVKGYTNVAPGTPMTFIMDENRTAKNDLGTKRALNIAHTNASGNYGGYERWFEAIVPFDKYGTALGDHFVTGYTSLSDMGTTAKFVLYDSPPAHYIPSQEVRYIAGENGPVEFNPTPTPIIQTVTVIQTVPVIQTVTIPVTPSNEVVHAEQQKALNETISWWVKAIIGSGIGIGIIVWFVSLYMRRKEMEE